VSSDTQDLNEGIPITVVSQVIGIFALVGVGIGLTGGVAISQLGSGGAILSGILILVVLTLALLLGPVIGIISGLRTGDEYGRSTGSYLAGLIGSVTGYFVMIFIVLIILTAVLAIVIGDGGSGSTAAQSAASTSASPTSSSGSLPIGEYIIPIIAVAIPTGITGIGGVYFGGYRDGSGEHIADNTLSEDTISTLSWKYVGIAIIIITVLAAGLTIGPELLSPQPEDLEIDGGAANTDITLFAEGTVTNPTNSEITTPIIIELVIDGSVVTTTEETTTVEANGVTTIRSEIATVNDLTNSEIESVANDNYELRFIIAGQTVETYRP
jgi:MFS family permease